MFFFSMFGIISSSFPPYFPIQRQHFGAQKYAQLEAAGAPGRQVGLSRGGHEALETGTLKLHSPARGLLGVMGVNPQKNRVYPLKMAF